MSKSYREVSKVARFLSIFLVMLMALTILPTAIGAGLVSAGSWSSNGVSSNVVPSKVVPSGNVPSNTDSNDSRSSDALGYCQDCIAGTVKWVAEDKITQGDWLFDPIGSPIGVYGSYAHILPNVPVKQTEIVIGNYSVPIGDNYSALSAPPYNWTPSQIAGLAFNKSNPPYWDEYVSDSPLVTYFVNGTYGPVQYPAFEWAWAGWNLTPIDSQFWWQEDFSGKMDTRAAWYTQFIPGTGGGPGYRLVAYDCGGERSQPLHGYVNVTMFFPQGAYLLSLYAYDFEKYQRFSELYRIYDSTGTKLLASKQISGTIFDNGVYEIFKVVAPSGGLTIIVQVYNDAGHDVLYKLPNGTWAFPSDKTLNVVLSGIFVDKIQCSWDGHTIGYWKNHLDMTGITSVLNDIHNRYSGVNWWWLPDNLTEAWLLLNYKDPNTGQLKSNDPEIKAAAQTLALLLTTEVYGFPDPTGPRVYIYPYGSFTVAQWTIKIITEWGKASPNYAFIQKVADYLNNM